MVATSGGIIAPDAGAQDSQRRREHYQRTKEVGTFSFQSVREAVTATKALRCFPLCSDELIQMVLLARGPSLWILKPGCRMRHPQRNAAQPNCGQRCGACQCRGLRAGPAGWTCGPEAAGLAGWAGPSAEGPRHRRSLQRLTCAKPGTETYPSTYVSLK